MENSISNQIQVQNTQQLSARQLQGLNALQLPDVELQTFVNDAIVHNPVLTMDPDEADPPPTLTCEDKDWLESILALPADQRYIHHNAPAGDEQDIRDFILDSIEQPVSFQSFMFQQLELANLPDDLHRAATAVIESLDDEGYLKVPEADLIMNTQLSPHLVQQAIKFVKTLDPPGVGAADIRERLLLKLAREGRKNELIYKVIRDHLDALGHNQIPQIAKSLRVSIEDLNEVVDEIRALRPTLDFKTEEITMPYIRPEVIFSVKGDDVIATVLNDRLPSIYISRSYKKMLADPNLPGEARTYIQGKIRDAANIIQSILQRQSTLTRISNALAKHQREFFINGPDALRPLTRQHIADECECHASTVARTVDNKMMQCPWGQFMLSYLFTGKVKCASENTEATTNETGMVGTNVIHTAIRNIIAQESPIKPLSDEKILQALLQQGFQITRRTVAKYRDQLHILPASLRKKFE